MHPSKIGRYQILGVLGHGGMGIVYDAIDPTLGRAAAVKVLRTGPGQDKGAVERFLAEATKIVRLEAHKSILTIYEADMDGSQPYVAMRKVDGVSLEKKLAAGILPLETVTRVMTAIGGALSFAHRHGIVHCDVKPSNILLDALGQPYLTDFGISRASPDPLGAREGHRDEYTPLYASPEQVLGGEPTVQSDVYSLGVVLYEMCTGTTPFGHVQGLTELRTALRNEAPCHARDVNGKIPEALDGVIHRAIARDPKQRFATAHDFLKSYLTAIKGMASAALTEVDREQQPAALAETVPPQTPALAVVSQPRSEPARSRGHRGAAWSVAATVVLGVAGYYALPGRSERHEAVQASSQPGPLPPAAVSRPSSAPEPGPESQPRSASTLASSVRSQAEPPAPPRPEPTPVAGEPEPVLARGPFALPADWSVEIMVPEMGPLTGLPRKVRDPRLVLEFVLIEPQVYFTGSTEPRDGSLSPTRVVIARPFYMAVTEISVGQMRTFAREKGWKAKECAFLDNPFPAYSALWKESQLPPVARFSDRHPAVRVRFLDATGFCVHYGYRLPTQAEWECAARAGTTSDFWFGTTAESARGCENVLGLETVRAPGQNFGSQGWPIEDGYVQTAPVGSFRKNPYGLADMLGNVREWVSDATESSEIGIACGGGWDLGPEHGMAGSRHRVGRAKALMDVGFRVVHEIEGH